jgi:hypothetical protein
MTDRVHASARNRKHTCRPIIPEYFSPQFVVTDIPNFAQAMALSPPIECKLHEPCQNAFSLLGRIEMTRITLAALAATTMLIAGNANAQESVDWNKIEIKTTDLGNKTYRLEGQGGNCPSSDKLRQMAV